MEAMQNQIMEHALLQAAQKIEDQLDDQLHSLENMNKDDVERLRQERLKVCSGTLQCIALVRVTHAEIMFLRFMVVVPSLSACASSGGSTALDQPGAWCHLAPLSTWPVRTGLHHATAQVHAL